MKPIKQMMREPGKMLLGIILIAVAVAILSVCVGQAIVSESTQKQLDYYCDTICLLTDDFQKTTIDTGKWIRHSFSTSMPEEITAWVEEIAETHPEIVKSISSPGMASAYIPELKQNNITSEEPEFYRLEKDYATGPILRTVPYSCAVLEITIESVSEPLDYLSETLNTTQLSYEGKILRVFGTVERVIGLEEGFRDPTGKPITLYIKMENEKEYSQITEMLYSNQHFLVYGMDYMDMDLELRMYLSAGEEVPEQIDTNRIRYYSDSERNAASWGEEVAGYFVGGMEISLTNVDIHSIEGIALTMGNPTMVPLKGSAEDFLASGEGKVWQDLLEEIRINAHVFPFIGVDKLGYLGDFAGQTARIVEGREFSNEELLEGSRVCIISEYQAAVAGLHVGDQITAQTINDDPAGSSNNILGEIASGYNTTNPAPHLYRTATDTNPTPLNPEENYTIIGLYRRNTAWADPSEDIYAFTPNTVFVPKNALTGTVEYGKQAFFRTLILQNGTAPQLEALAVEAGFDGLFVYDDQGYAQMAGQLDNYREISRLALTVGCGGYGIILFLFLLLFPARQKKNVRLMENMGDTRWERIRFVLLGALAVLIPGSVLGIFIGSQLWRFTVSKLTDLARISISLDMKPLVMLGIGIGQLVLAFVAVLILSVPLTKEGGMAKQ